MIDGLKIKLGAFELEVDGDLAMIGGALAFILAFLVLGLVAAVVT